jgi:DNA (cytosine-5)-methyltransferase 1
MNKKSQLNNKIKLATVFSGIGAIEHAFERMNIPYELVFACDNDKYVKQSFFANYDIDETRWYDDIEELNTKEAKKFKNKIDLFVGGSPCQSFSMVGKRKGLEDIRGSLFYNFAKIIKDTQPKIFIFENVKGLYSHDKGKTWEVIQGVFDELGYCWDKSLLNAKDYGIPQNRERVFVVGFKKARKIKFPEPIPLDSTMQDFLIDNHDSKYNLAKYVLGDKGRNFVTSEKNIKKRYTQINGKRQLCQKKNQQFNWHGDFVFTPQEIDDKYYLSDKVRDYVLSPGTKDFYSKPQTDLEVARPLLSTMHKMHRSGVDNYVTSKSKGTIRKLHPKECLKLMGFDDSFVQVVSDTRMYMQCGNSIVVNVLMHLLDSINIADFYNEDK